MSRAGRDLVGQDLDHDLGPQPGVGDQHGVDAGRLLGHLQWVGALVDLAPALVGEAGAQLADAHELVPVAVVDAGQQGAGAELGALAFAPVVAEEDDVDGVAQLAAGVALQLHPVEVARACLVRRIEPLYDHALESLADVVEQLARQHLDRVGLGERRRHQGVAAGKQPVDDLEALLVGQRSQVRAVAEHDVEHEGPQRRSCRGLGDAFLAAPGGGLLEGHVLLGSRVVCNGFAVQDHVLDRQPAGRFHQLREHVGHGFEVAREDAHLAVVAMDLDPQAVVLRLHAHQAQFLDDRLRVGKPLGQLRAQRLAHGHLQLIQRLHAGGSQGAGDQAQVGGPVVSAFQDRPEAAVALLSDRERVQHRRVADAQAHLAHRDPDQVLGRRRAQVGQQA